MALTTANVDTTSHTFQTWVDKTNILLDAYSTSIVTTAANSSGGFTTGNATVNGIFTANSISINGNTTFGLRGGNVTTNATLYVTSNVSIGNATVNTVITTTTIDTDLMLTVLGNTSLTNGTVTFTTGSSNVYTFGAGNANFDSGTLFIDATNNRIGINNTAPGVALRVTGAADISTTANVQGNANVGGTFGVAGVTTLTGNATLSGTLQTISGNVNIDTGTLFVDATNNRVGINNTAPGVALVVTGAADITLTANIQGAANVGGTFGVAGVTTLTGNATLSGALQTISGNTTFDSGVLFVDATNNRVGINNTAPTVALEVTGAANVSTSVNSSLFTIGTAFIANTTGAYHTGTVNAASYTTTGFVANTTAIVPTSNTILLGNSTGRFVISANTGNFSGAVTVSGNATLSGQLQTISGNVDIDSGTLFVDAATDSVKVKNLSTNTGSIYISNGALSGVTVMSIANGSIGSNITSAQTVASFTKTLYPTGQLTITASNTTHKQVEHLIFAHNDTDIQTTVFGRVAAPASANLGIANVVINGASLEINFSQVAINTKINILANLFTP